MTADSTQVRGFKQAVRDTGRFLIVATNFPPVRGGSAVVYYNLCKFSGGAGSVLAAASSYKTGRRLPECDAIDDAAGFPVHRIALLRPRDVAPGSRRLPSIVHFILFDIPLMVRVLHAVSAIARRDGIRVLCIGELVYGGWLALPAKYLLGLRVVHYIHGEEITNLAAESASERLKKSYLRHADAVVAVSNFTRDALIRLMEVDPAAIEIIHNGVDTERFKPRPRNDAMLVRYGIAGRRVILTVGRLVERKGVDLTLQALPDVLSRYPDIHYLIVGDGPYRPVLEDIACERGIADRVTFAGEVSDEELPDHYASCELFVMPNRELADGDTEGFGLVFLEANACGKPVIAGQAGGAVDAVRDGINGLTVDGSRPEQIAAAMIALLGDSDLYARLRDGGLAAARGADWRSRAEQFRALCRRLTVAGPDSSAALEGENRRIAAAHFRPLPRTIVEIDVTEPPQLLVIIDAEEEFDWNSISSTATSVATISQQYRAQRIFERYGLVPTYAVDFPVASQEGGYRPLREFLDSGTCEIGAQLHPWVTPPIEERICARNSFPGNLPHDLEFRKLSRLTEEIEARFRLRPTLYRAGRYGTGPNTATILSRLRYEIDCSVLPYSDLRPIGGPDYRELRVSKPYWFGPDESLFEIPVTTGMLGALCAHERLLYPMVASRIGQILRWPAVAARMRLLDRIRLTPEGSSLHEAKRLTRALMAAGSRVFVLSYHSPSLEPGHTPYVRTRDDLDRFLAWIEEYLDFFFEEMRGRASTPAAVRRRALALRNQS